LLAAAGTYAAGYLGLRRSLARFPWPPEQGFRLETRDGTLTVAGAVPILVGWPFGSLGPKFPDDPHISLRHALLTSALVRWWTHVFGCIPHDGADRLAVLSLISLTLTPTASVSRWGLYRSGYAPPISVWGRLLTGRWVIKGFDQVLVAPLLSFWVG